MDTTVGAGRKPLSGGRELLLVSAIYLLLTAILTYPTVLRLTTHIPGTGDAPTMVWDLWALTRAIIDPQVPLSTTDLIFYPLPDVASQWTSPANVLLSLPLTIAIGPVPVYNLLFLSSFVLAGLFTYLLVRRLTGDRLASFAAGSLFSFSACHFARGLGHWNLFSVQWLPLCALCLLRLRAKPDLSRTLQFVVATSLVALTFPYFAAYFLLPFLACFFLWCLWRDRSAFRSPHFLSAVALGLGVAVGATLLFYGDVVFPGEEMAAAIRTTSRDTERYSADLLAFVLPSASHPVFGSVVAPIYDNFSARGNPAEMTVFLGWTTVVLAAWGLRSGRRVGLSMWVVLALFCLVLSLGPVLRVNGQALFPLPYTLLMKLPVFSALRAPSRASITVTLCLSVLAGYGVRELLGRIGARSVAKTAVVGAVVLIGSFESLLSFPYRSSSAAVPVFYEKELAELQDGALFQVPSGPGHSESAGWYMFYQTHHHHKLAIGYQARDPLNVVLFPHWVLRGDPLSPPLTLFESDDWAAFESSFASVLAYNDIRYVVVQRQAGPLAVTYSEREFEEVKAFLSRSLGEPIYQDDGLVAHEVSPRTEQARASFSGKLELVDHKILETTSCPDGVSHCTFLVTFWRARVSLPGKHVLRVQLVRHDRNGVLAATAHSLGYQFTLGEEVACYNTSWWAPGVVIADYTLLPSADVEGLPLSEQVDIRIRVTEPKTRVILPAQSDYYAVDAQGRLLIESYRP